MVLLLTFYFDITHFLCGQNHFGGYWGGGAEFLVHHIY